MGSVFFSVKLIQIFVWPNNSREKNFFRLVSFGNMKKIERVFWIAFEISYYYLHFITIIYFLSKIRIVTLLISLKS